MSGHGPPGNRARVARRALRLKEREGLNATQIAYRLGMSRSYISAVLEDPEGIKDKARKDSYRKPCPHCGRLMSGQDGPNSRKAPSMCLNCARERDMADKHWTAEAIIDAIQTFAREKGRPPVASEWLHGTRDPRFPRPSSIYRSAHHSARTNPFASWADAIEAAGFPRPKRGHKTYPRGQGVSNMKRTYYVLTRNGDGSLHEEQVEAFSPEGAIEAFASSAGTYIAVLDRYWVEREVAPVTKLAVLAKE